MRPFLLAPLLVLVACTASAGTGSPPAAPPPLLMQYVGEYDAPSGGRVSSLTLHVDGSFDAASTGGTRQGTFAVSEAAAKDMVRATLQEADGSTSMATFRAATGFSDGPPRSQVELGGALGAATLVGQWVGGDETMCRSTEGHWTDDDPDPATGLFCRCGDSRLYLPSRGGCVGAVSSGDPARAPLTASARAAVGRYVGSGRVTEVSLTDDGTYRSTVDGHADAGTWWDAGGPGSLALTSPGEACWATSTSGALTLDLGDHVETLHRDR
jgi:hypothetical protein